MVEIPEIEIIIVTGTKGQSKQEDVQDENIISSRVERNKNEMSVYLHFIV